MTDNTTQRNNSKQIWIRNELYEKLNQLRIRDETNNSIVNFLYEFYMDNRGENQ